MLTSRQVTDSFRLNNQSVVNYHFFIFVFEFCFQSERVLQVLQGVEHPHTDDMQLIANGTLLNSKLIMS